MALIFFACWIVWALQEDGVRAVFPKNFRAERRERRGAEVLLAVVFFAAGCLEIISILFRPVSFSFRLYGNIFAGENDARDDGDACPRLGWLLPIPFYFLELLVGLVQALVFMLLTAVFTLLICQPTRKGQPHDRQHPCRPRGAGRGDRRRLDRRGVVRGRGRNPGASTKSWCSPSCPSPLPKRSSSTRCSS